MWLVSWKINLTLCLLLAFMSPGVRMARGQDSTGSGGVLLSTLIDEAMQNNPQIKQMQSSWRASREAVPQAGAWMDPQLGINLMSLPLHSFDFREEPMTGKQLTLMQEIPLRGISGLKTGISEESAAQAKSSYEDVENDILYQVKAAYYSLFYTDKALRITAKNKSLLEDFIRIAESKYSTGSGPQQDVLKAQVELSKMLEKLIVLRGTRSTTLAQINSLLSRDTDTRIDSLAEVTDQPFDHPLEELKEMALKSRPLLQAMTSGVRRAELSHRLAEKSRWPSVNLGVGYTQRDGMPDFISGMFSVSLPVFAGRKQSREIAQSRYEVDAARQQYNTARNDLYFEVADLYNQIHQNCQLLPLYSGAIIPQASQSLQSAVAGYQVNKIDFLTLLDNQLTLYEYEMEYYRVLSEYRQEVSRLEWVVGEQLIQSLQ